jgi:hypothetical protein
MYQKMKLAIAAAGTLLGLATLYANPAQAAKVTFEEFNAGDTFPPAGSSTPTPPGVAVTIGGIGNGTTGGNPRLPMIFDSTCGGGPASNCTGNDDDLFFGNQFGNVLIISQNNNSASPNDSRFGGTLTFDFSEPIFLKSFVYLDGDENRPATFETFNGSTLVDSLSSPGAGDNQFITVDGFSNTKVTRLEVDLPGSGAIDDVTYAVPEPLTILGSSMALGFGALFKKQQSKKQKKN